MQGFYVNKVTRQTKEYSYILLYLSEQENEAYDSTKLLHFTSSISWIGTYSGVKYRLKHNKDNVERTTNNLVRTFRKRIAQQIWYSQIIEEEGLMDYMCKEVEDYIFIFVVSCLF